MCNGLQTLKTKPDFYVYACCCSGIGSFDVMSKTFLTPTYVSCWLNIAKLLYDFSIFFPCIQFVLCKFSLVFSSKWNKKS